ncbi:hypothetical protein [Bradyrhizobium sp. USDA 3458]|uniref:hypothetical protein n=1 Tax=Bradyrhizobium sp. USDA 3458 TaxID=2591461 RepID=UPI001144ED5D|nr:hypothetical protein [Bradyrhizobium sp. USDA 3458]
MSDDDFSWSINNEDVVVPDQRKTAIYTNQWGQAVIRQERAWDEPEDTFVVIDHSHLPTVIAALLKIADVAPVRDYGPGAVVPDSAEQSGP